MSSLTAEQRQRIEENRKRAQELKKKAATAAAAPANNNSAASSSVQGSKPVPSKSFYGPNSKKPLDVTVAKKPKLETKEVPKSSMPSQANQGICKLLSKDRFKVAMGYNQQVIEIFKSIPSRQYDAIAKIWTFQLKDHNKLKEAVKAVKPPFYLTPIPAKIVELMQQPSASTEDIDLSSLDPVCRDALMPFQVDGIKFCISKGGRAMLADDMGLGKTIQALAVANYYKEDWPLLIVCPSSVRFSWAESFRMWLPSVPWHEVVVMTNGKEFVADARILIISYDLLTRQKDMLEKMKFGVVIMDESHSVKNTKSKRSEAAGKLVRSAKRLLMLTGTPALSRPIELYSQLNIIRPNALMKLHEYGVRYCAAKETNWGWDYSGSCNMDELSIVLKECFMIRRLKKDVLTQLPGKFRQTVVLPVGSIIKEQKELEAAKARLLNVNSNSEKHGALLHYFHETSYIKIKAICDYIVELLEEGKKFLCFAHHKAVLDAVCDRVIRSKFRYIRIDGETSSAARLEACQTFQEDPACKVAVLSIMAANSGITLTAAHMVVFAELFWNPGIMLQAEDRVHRIGQQNTVVVQYLVAKDTSDDHMWNLLQKKLAVLNKAGLNQDNLTDTSSTRVLQDTDQNKITKYIQKTSKDEEEEDMLDDVDWDAIDAEVSACSK
ncbi:Hypothetical predicted protein [Cloeon dipterum]|uniref:SWI/SNF-related matrix-associated actin-dependent regulator of chromatin subfamily A-like protein 1 n=1 Tax=Cloeon dipterum TaxID=197152 RepID=A0A8S1D9I3_9INSE|nr:Hypothetical predicted protein [Cloeon dipterum]